MVPRNRHSRRFSLTRWVAAFALGLLFIAGPARAQDSDGFELLDVATAAAGAYPVAYAAIQTKTLFRQFFVTYGLSGDCGKLYELVYNSTEFKWEAFVRYTFDKIDKAGCNPINLIAHPSTTAFPTE